MSQYTESEVDTERTESEAESEDVASAAVRGRIKLPPLDGTKQHTVVAVPEGGGSPEKSKARGDTSTLISIPGEMDTNVPQRGKGGSGPPIEIVVYFMDKSGISLPVEDGQHCEAGELFEMVMDEMNFVPEARDVFSLWLVSDLLELQLKAEHIPFKLVAYWEELCEKYTTAKEEVIERDEPVIMFQRNVFYPRSKEKLITDPDLLKLLYNEAKENVVDSRYPIELPQCDYLAGLQVLISEGAFDPDRHTQQYYKSKGEEYYPERYAKRKMFSGPDPPEKRLVTKHEETNKKFKHDDKVSLYIAYLESVWPLPYYGAAMFKGQIEHPPKKVKLLSNEDDPVYVAVNTDGVFIIDMDDVDFLLGLLFKDLNWDYAEPRNKDNPDSMPCLFLQWGAKEESKDVTKLLQIFSREGVLIDNLIETCVQLKRDRKKKGGIEAQDGVIDDDGIIEGDANAWKKFNRLCLQTFDRKVKTARV